MIPYPARRISFLGTALLITSVLVGGAPAAETLDAPIGALVVYGLDSGAFDNAHDVPRMVFNVAVTVDDAAWVRLYFGTVELPEGSFLRLVSQLDGYTQHLDSTRLLEWSNTSAYFNGNTVRIELVAGPATVGNRVRLDHVTVQFGGGATAGFCGICDDDDRVASNEAFTGRLMPVGCTASMYNDRGCFVSAGHCMGDALIMEFNVPPSNPDGTVQHPGPEDQYPVEQDSIEFTNGGVGDDWSHFTCAPNSETGLPVADVQGEFRPIAQILPNSFPQDIEVFGYGVDTQPLASATQQQSIGTLDGVFTQNLHPAWEYMADTTFGNSGSAILLGGEIIGIVTHCTGGCVNFGTIVNHGAFTLARRECELSYDFDGDGDIDAADFAGWQNCYPIAPLPDGCEVFDVNGNNRIDLGDLPSFLMFFEGPQQR